MTRPRFGIFVVGVLTAVACGFFSEGEGESPPPPPPPPQTTAPAGGPVAPTAGTEPTAAAPGGG
ncbi:MAG TPA: hypothetical protein VFC00_14155 [Micromonosporaceae bacterium]|nr:hypothetical protein [Micromonosporaceae bacterium]